METVSCQKKHPKIIRCVDCNGEFAANISKEELLKQNGIDANSIKSIISDCCHPLCPACVTKTIQRSYIKNGFCDQCMWWEIT